MFNYILLFTVVVGSVLQSVFQKQYNSNYSEIKNSNYLYNFTMTFAAFIWFLVVFLFSPQINLSSLIYSLLFAITICMAIVFSFLAIKTGPLALTTLIVQFSLLIPTFYDVIFCGYSLSVFAIIGIFALVSSLLLVFDFKQKDKHISKKYIIYIIFAFLGNGFCSTFQKMHQLKYEQNAGFFMASAMLMVSLFNLIMFIKNKPENINGLFSKGVLLSGVTGLFNGLVNLLMVILSTRLASVVLYPTVSAGSMIILFFIAVLCYKERFKLYQYFGYFVGVVAIVFLNI